MLEFLCYRYVDIMLLQVVLNKFYIFVYNNEEFYVNKGLKDIFWEIFGICYEIIGNFQVVRFFYKCLFKQNLVNKI